MRVSVDLRRAFVGSGDMFQLPEQKSSLESSEYLLSVECSKPGFYRLIGQFCSDVSGCKTQVA